MRQSEPTTQAEPTMITAGRKWIKVENNDPNYSTYEMEFPHGSLVLMVNRGHPSMALAFVPKELPSTCNVTPTIHPILGNAAPRPDKTPRTVPVPVDTTYAKLKNGKPAK